MYVCSASNQDDYVPAHLPNAKFLSMCKDDQTLFFTTLMKCRFGPKMLQATRANLHTNTVEARWKSSDKANMKGITSIRNHTAKAFSGYLKHSVGRGIDAIRVAMSTGNVVSASLVQRAAVKQRKYTRRSSTRNKKRARVRRMKNHAFRTPLRDLTEVPQKKAYQGLSTDFR